MQSELLFFFSALGAFNGIFLAAYFLFFARPKHTSHRYLGLLFLALSVRVGKSVFFYFYYSLSAIFIQIGLLACWMIGPLLLLYVREALDVGNRSRKVANSIILMFLLFGMVVMVALPRDQYPHLWVDLVYVIYAQWGIFVILAGYHIAKNSQKLVGRKVSNLFVLWFVSIYFGNMLIWLAFTTAEYTSYIVGALSFSFVFYILLLFMLFSKKRNELFLLDSLRYRSNRISQDEAHAISKALQGVVKEQKVFLDSDLSLKQLAELLNTTPLKVSQVFNEHMKTTFNDYINGHRVEWSKKMILDKKSYALEAISLESGFNSTSTFYSAFKKREGLTPAKFRDANLDK